MRVGLGVSTGTEVVCAALVVAEDDGSYTVDYRTVSADTQANTDIGDLVSSAVELMTSLAPAPAGHGAHSTERHEPESIAVSYRTAEQASSIRSACAHSPRSISLIPETAAAHAFLAESGLIARYRNVAVVDIGASGTTTSILDSQSGHVHSSERSDSFGGDVVDALVKNLAHGNPAREVRDDLRDDRGIGSARYRAVKEHLSTHDTAGVDRNDGEATLDRADLDSAMRPLVERLAQSTARIASDADVEPEAVVLIGGGSNTPSVRTVFGSTLGLPVLVVPEPDSVLAIGAAQLALAGPSHSYPTVGAHGDSQGRSVGRFSGALLGALVVGGIVLAYGVQTLTPSDDSGYSPAGSVAPSEPQGSVVDEPVLNTTSPETSSGSSQQVQPTSPSGAAQSSQQPASSSADVVPSTPTPTTTRTPTLHPAPDLPVIPYPAEPSAPSSPPPVTTTPQPSTTVPPVDTPPTDSESGEPSPTPTPTPEQPSATPEESTAIVPPSIPTTVVDGTPTSPELAPPPTVWTPPPPASGASSETSTPEPTTTTQPSTAQSNPTTTTEQ